MKRFTDPVWITARFPSQCAGCREGINKKDRALYYPGKKKAYCEKCGDEISKGIRAEKSMEAYGTDIFI